MFFRIEFGPSGLHFIVLFHCNILELLITTEEEKNDSDDSCTRLL